jgi:hypothetical protein
LLAIFHTSIGLMASEAENMTAEATDCALTLFRPPKWARAVSVGGRLRIVRSDDARLCKETAMEATLLRQREESIPMVELVEQELCIAAQ